LKLIAPEANFEFKNTNKSKRIAFVGQPTSSIFAGETSEGGMSDSGSMTFEDRMAPLPVGSYG
jgi:hypothetical protein